MSIAFKCNDEIDMEFIYKLQIKMKSEDEKSSIKATGFFSFINICYIHNSHDNKIYCNNKISTLRKGIVWNHIPERYNRYYGVRGFDETPNIPATVEKFVVTNRFGTIIMTDEFSKWFNSNIGEYSFGIISHMIVTEPISDEIVLEMRIVENEL
jgi:hypothetical protein